MAKANDKSSTIDWIWLDEALMLAIPRFGSEVLAKALLTEWLAAGKLPWSCMAWKPLNVEGLTELEVSAWKSAEHLRAPPALREGEPEFWRYDHTISWEDNLADQNSDVGARALGVKVSREHLIALLPEEPRERVEELGQTKPAEPELLAPKKEPKAWLSWARKEYPKGQNERPTDYVRRLHGLMQTADSVTKVWGLETFRVRYYEAVKTDQQAVQKKRESPRGV